MTDPGDPGAAARLARLADGYLATQLLHAAVALGLPEALADGPRGAHDLAGELGAVPGLLHRVLRGLAAEEVVEERPDGRFALTALGTLLTSEAPGSLRGAVSARGEVYYQAAAGLVDALRGDGTPYEVVHGLPFPHLAGDPSRPSTSPACGRSAATSSRESRAAPTSTCSRACCTTGTTATPRRRSVSALNASIAVPRASRSLASLTCCTAQPRPANRAGTSSLNARLVLPSTAGVPTVS